MPHVTDRDYAARNLELAVLSAVMHGERAPPDVASDIALAALHALAHGAAVEGDGNSAVDGSVDSSVDSTVDSSVDSTVDSAVDSERRQDYCDMVLATLGRAARTLMEERMRYRDENDPNPYYSEFARANWDKGRAEGEALGRAEGERAALLAVLAARGIAVGDDFVARIRACNDLAQLTAWLQRAATATSLGDVLDG